MFKLNYNASCGENLIIYSKCSPMLPQERVSVCACACTQVSVYLTWFVQVHICIWMRVLLTELSFRDTVSFHFNAWLVNNCLCGWYDVYHSRRAFSMFLCVCVYLCVILVCSFNRDKDAPRRNLFLSVTAICTRTIYNTHTHIFTHFQAYKSVLICSLWTVD